MFRVAGSPSRKGVRGVHHENLYANLCILEHFNCKKLLHYPTLIIMFRLLLAPTWAYPHRSLGWATARPSSQVQMTASKSKIVLVTKLALTACGAVIVVVSCCFLSVGLEIFYRVYLLQRCDV